MDFEIRCLLFSQYHKVAAVHGAGAALHHIDRKAGVGLLHARHHGVFQNGHIGQGLYLFEQLVQDLRTGGIFVVENAVAAVTALQCPVGVAVPCPGLYGVRSKSTPKSRIA